MIRASLLIASALLTQVSGCKAWITEKEAELYADEDRDGVGWDEDCDDDDPDVAAAGEWYVDADGDGWGDETSTILSCGQPEGAVALRGDCDDSDDSVYPGATEDPYDDVDQDCDGEDLQDLDGDGFPGKDVGGSDCDDEDETVYPGAPDGYYDGIDQDCDGFTGTDMDKDGSDAEIVGGDDCNDDDDDIFPGAEDAWYDGVDQNCDGADDFDQDADGEPAEGWGDDCDDLDGEVNPAAEEICSDGLDNNCDGAATCGLMGETDLLGADGMRYGATKGDRAGHALAAVGDFDLDGSGLNDLVVGARYSDLDSSNAGAAYVVSGPITGSASLAEATAVLIGENAGDEAGYSVDSAGSLDGDDADDLIIGAPRRDAGDVDAGGVYLVLGPISGSMSLGESAVHLIAGDEDYDYAGQAVAGAGDMNRDGLSDVAIGAPGVNSKAGAVYFLHELREGDVLIGSVEGVWFGEQAADYAGGALDGAGDVNADGYDDVIVGAYQLDAGGEDRGAAYLVFGPGDEDDASLSDADARLLGEQDDDGAGYAVAAAGDVNGDGYDDVAVGAPYEDSAGAGNGVSYLVYGPVGGDFNLYNADARLYGATDGEQSGMALAAGDLNVDGSADLVVGAPYGSDDTLADFGYAYVVYGPYSGDLSLLDADARIAGTAGSLYGASALAVADDLDGDEVGDLIIGGWGYAPISTDTNTGGLWVFLGGGL